jgi:hypothetical protein
LLVYENVDVPKKIFSRKRKRERYEVTRNSYIFIYTALLAWRWWWNRDYVGLDMCMGM